MCRRSGARFSFATIPSSFQPRGEPAREKEQQPDEQTGPGRMLAPVWPASTAPQLVKLAGLLGLGGFGVAQPRCPGAAGPALVAVPLRAHAPRTWPCLLMAAFPC